MSNALTVRMYYQIDGDPFICEVHGPVTVGALESIEQDATDNPAETFQQGEGVYLFRADWFPGQYGDEGRCELPPYFELTQLEFKPHQTESA